MSTSGTFTFGSSNNDAVVTEAFERLGILGDALTAQQIQSATRSFNLLLSQWISQGPNLWTVKEEMLSLTPNQGTYSMPTATSCILEATIRTSQRPLGGTAYSSAGGTAAYAFDDNSLTACTQTSADGYISYYYGANGDYGIAMVGIQSNVTTTYTLVGEYSSDNVTWTNSITIPAQTYTAGINVWFIPQVPTNATYYRIRETGGATLNVQELYFNTTLNDVPITAISRSEWVSYPNKNQSGRPTSFYFNRQINPSVTLWPVPSAGYNNLYYTRVEEMQDVGSLTNTPQIPQRFFEAACSGMAWRLAMKYAPEKAEALKADYQQAFDIACREDRERVPTRIYGSFMNGWGNPL